jgi:hypothetical protein
MWPIFRRILRSREKDQQQFPDRRPAGGAWPVPMPTWTPSLVYFTRTYPAASQA